MRWDEAWPCNGRVPPAKESCCSASCRGGADALEGSRHPPACCRGAMTALLRHGATSPPRPPRHLPGLRFSRAPCLPDLDFVDLGARVVVLLHRTQQLHALDQPTLCSARGRRGSRQQTEGLHLCGQKAAGNTGERASKARSPARICCARCCHPRAKPRPQRRSRAGEGMRRSSVSQQVAASRAPT